MLVLRMVAIFVATATISVFGQTTDENQEPENPIEFEEQLVVTASRAGTR